MQKWDYRVLVISGAPTGELSDISELPCQDRKSVEARGRYENLAKILDAAAQDGWQVCGTVSQGSGSLIIMKHPQEERPSKLGQSEPIHFMVTPDEDEA